VHCILVSREGFTFRSCKAATDYLKMNSKYEDEDVENIFKIFKSSQNTRRKEESRKEATVWMSAENLPSGWKMRIPQEGSDKK
jgi:hypothetical protein